MPFDLSQSYARTVGLRTRPLATGRPDETEEEETPETKPKSLVDSAYSRVLSKPKPSPEAKPEELSVGKGVKRALGRGVGGMLEGAGGFLQSDLSKLDPVSVIREPVMKAIKKVTGANLDLADPIEKVAASAGRKIQAEGERIRSDPTMAPSKSVAEGPVFQPKNPRWWIESGSEMVPQLATQVGIAALSRGASLPAQMAAFAGPTFVTEAGSAYNEAFKVWKDRGLSDKDARTRATGEGYLVGGAAMALESIPQAAIIRKKIPGLERLIGEAIMKKAPARFAAGFTAEGFTEAAQEATADVIGALARQDPTILEGLPERMLASFALGGVTGGAFGVATPGPRAADPAQSQPVPQETPADAPAAQPIPTPAPAQAAGGTPPQEIRTGDLPRQTPDAGTPPAAEPVKAPPGGTPGVPRRDIGSRARVPTKSETDTFRAVIRTVAPDFLTVADETGFNVETPHGSTLAVRYINRIDPKQMGEGAETRFRMEIAEALGKTPETVTQAELNAHVAEAAFIDQRDFEIDIDGETIDTDHVILLSGQSGKGQVPFETYRWARSQLLTDADRATLQQAFPSEEAEADAFSKMLLNQIDNPARTVFSRIRDFFKGLLDAIGWQPVTAGGKGEKIHREIASGKKAKEAASRPAPKPAPNDAPVKFKPGKKRDRAAEIASPVVDGTDAERNAVSAVDRVLGPPPRRADAQVQAEADAVLGDRSPETMNRVRDSFLDRVRTGGQITDADVLVGKELVSQSARTVIRSDDPKAWSELAEIVIAYRQTGTDHARAMRQRRNPNETPEQRRVRLLTEALLLPSQKAQKAINALRRKGENARAKSILDQHHKDVKALIDKLKAGGFDIRGMIDPEGNEYQILLRDIDIMILRALDKMGRVSERTAREKLKRREARIKALVEKIMDRTGEKAVVDKAIADVKKEIEELRGELQSVNVRRARKSLEAWEGRLEATRKKVAEEFPRLTEEHELIQQAIDTARDGVSELRGELSDEKKKVRLEQGKLDRLIATLARKQAELEKQKGDTRDALDLGAQVMGSLHDQLSEIRDAIRRERALVRSREKQIARALKKLGWLSENHGKLAAQALTQARNLELLKRIQEAKGDRWDAVYEYYLSSLLSFPATHAANIIGTSANVGWNLTVERLVEAGINSLVRNPGGATARELRHVWRSVIRSMPEAANNARLAFAEDFMHMESELAGGGAEQHNTSRTGGKVRKVLRIPLRALLAEDVFIKTVAARAEVAAVAYRIARTQGLQPGTIEMDAAMDEMMNDRDGEAWAAAVSKAEELSFTNQPGEITKAVRNLRDKIPGARYLIPFINTPANVMRSGIRKSPLGIIPLAHKMGKDGWIRLHPHTATEWTYTTRDKFRDVSEQVIAWMGVAALFALTDDDDPYITGNDVSWAREKREEREGRARANLPPPLSVKIGGKWYSYARIEPFATALGTSIDLVHAVRQTNGGAEADAVIGDLFSKQISNLEDKTFLQGLSDLMDMKARPDEIPKTAARTAASFVPNIIRSGARNTDPYMRDSKIRGGLWEEIFWSNLAKKGVGYNAFPTADNAPPPRVDPWGNEVKKDQIGPTAANWLYNMLVPVRVQGRKSLPGMELDRLIANWNAENPGRKFLFSPPPTTLQHDGETVRLTDDEIHDYLKLAGRIALEDLESMSHLEKLDERDIEDIRRAFRRAREDARDAIIDEMFRDGRL